ncbi:MAG TPA: hypothetical protein QF873_00215 [Patescibacteria group bacterium]|nr:hypothetical protein [Patescibacteria group bacterium]
MYSQQVQTQIHTTARPTIARAVVGFVTIAMFFTLGAQWANTSLANQSGAVASGTKLGNNVVAVVSLYDRAQNHSFLNRTKAHLLIDKEARTIGLFDDGEIVEISDDELAKYVTDRSRPHGWFMPGTLGVVHFRDDSGQIRSSRLYGGDNQLTLADRNSQDRISSLIPENAMYGAHLDCNGECPKVSIHDVELQIPQSLQGSDFFSINVDKDMGSLFIIDEKLSQFHEIEDFARKILSRSQPEVRERTLSDGVVISELVPGSDLATEQHGGVTKYGSTDAALYMFGAIKDNGITRYLSSTNSIFSDDGSLSTLSWTNRICDVKPSYFFALSFSATFAENPKAPLYVARSRDGWRVCER